MKTSPLSIVLWSIVAVLGACESSTGQMLDPSIDRPDEPFCYFSQPTDVLGVMDGTEGTLVTPEGYLYTGFGEFMFFTGNPPLPVNQRVKTLYKGYLPMIEYSFRRDGLDYRVRMFAATLDGNPESPLVNFVRVTVMNPGKTKRTGYFGIATRYQNDVNSSWDGTGDHRFVRPATAKMLGQYEQAGEAFNKDWEYAFGEGLFLRDGKVMYVFPENLPHVTMMTMRTGYNTPPDRLPGKKSILPTTPVGVVLYGFSLRSDEHQTLEFRIPEEPLPQGSPLLAQLRAATFDNLLGQMTASWEAIFSRGTEITVPEEKVEDVFKASLVYDLIARNRQEGSYIQKVNDFQYHAFWLRDASFIVHAYDQTGYHDIARQCLEFFPRWQQPDGNFVSQGGQFDGWGQALWAFGQHYRLTRDTAYAISVYPLIVKAVEWLRSARQNDPLHLLPATSPGDNENITGHVTGHDFWALAGLRQATIMARDLGRTDDAAAFQVEYDSMHDVLVQRLHTITAKTGGYITPGLDTLGGEDWDNMSALYPEILLDPHDPMVSGTLDATRRKYAEGLMTYGNGRWLHHYLTISNTESEVIRGEEEPAVRDLYALLLHTSATHAGFEFCIRPWGDRDFGMNLSPHGWFAARFRSLLRDMLVREDDEQVHLLSAISPEWIGRRQPIVVHHAPTNFGDVSYTLTSRGNTAQLNLETQFAARPRRLILHFPWFMRVQAVKVDGIVVKARMRGSLELPLRTKKVDIQWTRRKGKPVLNYVQTVQEYKKEYRRRYNEYLKQGRLPD